MIRIRRRVEPPPTLVHKARPFKEDVRAALAEDFFGKCYLCEGNAKGSFDVEHLKPVVDFPEHEFDWHNLFPACSRCNERRKRWSADEREPAHKRWPKGGMLDCAEDDIESRLHQILTADVGGVATQFFPADREDRAAANTAKELDAIHSLYDQWGRQICSLIDHRYRAVLESYARLNKALAEHGHDPNAPVVRTREAELRLMLSPAAPYAGLIRAKMMEFLPAPMADRVM